MPTVAELIVEGLLRAEVPRIFGVPGGGSNLEILVTGELTGRPGAVLSTLGPGVTASATGLAHALLDRSPLLYLSDRHPAGVLAYATHQYVDHAAHLGPTLRFALRHAIGDDLLGKFHLRVRVSDRQDGTRVSGRELAALELRLDGVRERQ